MIRNRFRDSLSGLYLFFFFFIFSTISRATGSDSISAERISFHFQTTVIHQYKPSFKVPYSGINSLQPGHEGQTSVTSTFYSGLKLWKGSGVFFNPELAGGSGLSEALGVAASTNGETFRVGNPAPSVYLARLFFTQVFSLSEEKVFVESDINQLAGSVPAKYFAFTIGKISVADFFDDNIFSHDPRTQFLSWGLMDNGAWDFAANTRGYTPSFEMEVVSPTNELRYSVSLVPLKANGNKMNWDPGQASSHNLEYTHRHNFGNKGGAVRVLVFYTSANMGTYKKSVNDNPLAPDIRATRQFRNTKYGITLNAEQQLTNSLGCFFRAGWNDGKHETWMFTEIDHSFSAGLSMRGEGWKRRNDNIGLAFVASGLSKEHKEYLKAGGLGFILGDGNLKYSLEKLGECYYSASLMKENLFLSGTFQLLFNPGYNKARQGPVEIFSFRMRAQI